MVLKDIQIQVKSFNMVTNERYETDEPRSAFQIYDGIAGITESKNINAVNRRSMAIFVERLLKFTNSNEHATKFRAGTWIFEIQAA